MSQVPPETDPPLPEAIATFDRDGRLLSDLPCYHCGYNLRMQTMTGHCSECGTSMAFTVRRMNEDIRLREARRTGTTNFIRFATVMFLIFVGVVLLLVTLRDLRVIWMK